MISRLIKRKEGGFGAQVVAMTVDVTLILIFAPIVSCFYASLKAAKSLFMALCHKPFKAIFRFIGIGCAFYGGSILGAVLGTLIMPGAGTLAGAFFGIAILFICVGLVTFLTKQFSRGLTYLYSTIVFPNADGQEKVISKTNPWKYRLNFDPSSVVENNAYIINNSYKDIARFLEAIRMAKNNLLFISRANIVTHNVLEGYITAMKDGRLLVQRQVTESDVDDYVVMVHARINRGGATEVNGQVLLDKSNVKLLGEIFNRQNVTIDQERQLAKLQTVPGDAVAMPAFKRGR